VPVKTVMLAITLAILATAAGAEADDQAPGQHDDARMDPSFARGQLAGRFAVVGAYRGLYDLSLTGGGLELSVGTESKPFGVFVNGRFIDMRTAAGLVALEGNLSVTFEGSVGPGFRLGAGVGGTYLAVERATSGSPLQSFGPMFLGRVGYDFGDAPNVFVLADLEVQSQASGAIPWGPTLLAGLRF
jgi:hypothetical protein